MVVWQYGGGIISLLDSAMGFKPGAWLDWQFGSIFPLSDSYRSSKQRRSTHRVTFFMEHAENPQ